MFDYFAQNKTNHYSIIKIVVYFLSINLTIYCFSPDFFYTNVKHASVVFTL